MYARQSKKALYVAICRSYDILSVWFGEELKLVILIFPISAIMISSREPVTLHINSLTFGISKSN